MRRDSLLRLALARGLAALLLCGPIAAAADKSAAELLPASIVGYLEMPQPGRAMDLVLDHPLARAIQEQPDYQRALERPANQRVLAAVERVEEKLGMPWREAARSLTAGGLYFGFDLTSQGVAGLALAKDKQLASKALETVVELAREEAARNGRPDPVKQEELRGLTVYQIGEARFATLGPWLVATNKKVLLYLIVENYLSGGETLAGDEQFQAVHKSRAGEPAAWMYLDLRVLREFGVLKAALSKKSDNPGVELLAGGVIGALPDAKYVTVSLEMNASRLKLTAPIPCDPAAIAKTREFYFGLDGNGVAPPLVAPRGTLFALSTYRDFASLWRHAPDLFDERINAKFAEAESTLTTFFAGRNFRDEILDNLEPGMQLVVARQEFPQAGVTPAIKLPAGAVVFRMKRPEETSRIFKITFQSAVGFLNVVGGMKGVDPLEQNAEKIGDSLVVSTQYLPPKETDDNGGAAIHYNASPTLALIGDRFILSSSRPLAMELIELVRNEKPARDRVNTQFRIDGQAVHAALADNRDPLIDQNMLGKGHERAAAEREIDGVLAVLSNLEESSLRLATEGKLLQLSLELVLKDTP